MLSTLCVMGKLVCLSTVIVKRYVLLPTMKEELHSFVAKAQLLFCDKISVPRDITRASCIVLKSLVDK